MKKISLIFCGVFLTLFSISISAFSEVWLVTSITQAFRWTKVSGDIPEEHFDFMCTKGCSCEGSGILYTTSNNHTTGDFEYECSEGNLNYPYHTVFLGKKEGNTAEGDFLEVDLKERTGIQVDWQALISKQDDNLK